MSNEKYKLHPITTVINFLKAFKELLIPIAILIVANGFNFNFDYRDENFIGEMIPLLFLFVFVIYSLFNGIVKWWTFTYWFEDSELRVEYGLFVKKKRYIPFDRIQSLNYKEGIFHRLFGLVQVMVETAGSKNGKPEAELTAVTRQAAEQIEREMKKAKQITTGDAAVVEEILQPPVKVLHKMATGELLLLATTSSGIGVVLAGIIAAVSQFADLIPFEMIFKELSYLMKYSFLIITILVVISLILAWVVSVIMTFLSYYNFTVTEESERLVITRGLLEKKRITIPLNRVQAIKIVENPFRQMLGLAAVVVESAGGGFSGDKDKKIVLFPLISKKAALNPLNELFPQLNFNYTPEVSSPNRARKFFYRIDFIWVVPLMVVLSYFFFPYGLLSLLLIVPVIVLGIWRHKTAGFTIADQQLTIVSRGISRVTFFAEKKRIQVVQSSQSYFQKRKKVASARIVVMSGMNGAAAKAYHMEQQQIEEIYHWYERE
ncbi:PH domain-containing protein [Solibacillus sp. FSL H8-0538]|uniref:PH domain-containing protein n=1 Tax=Solibacillus sp. FSL H8-0538 TaxID=2921400 RepID=UPI0030F937F8